MNNRNMPYNHSSALEKLPQEFCENHPYVTLAGCVFFGVLPYLPYLGKGIKYLVDQHYINARYRMAVENGLISNIIFDVSDVTSSEAAAVS